jgi:cytochrome c-type biogenesis protein CcmE
MPTGRSGRSKLPFAAGIVVILATVAWLAYTGIQESKTYFVTVSELFSNEDLRERRLRVAGDVTTGSILREDGRVNFQIQEGGKLLKVVYTGTEPLPDTLQDGAEAIADGRYQADGVFLAEAVQAKCPSKYEAQAAEKKAAGMKPGEYMPPPKAGAAASMQEKFNGGYSDAGYQSDYSGGYKKN